MPQLGQSVLIGNTRTLIEQVENPVSMAPDGSGMGVIIEKATWPIVQNNIPVPLSPHPSFPSLLLYEFTIEREAGNIGKVTGVYRGVLAANPLDLMQEEVDVATSSEPIETNPLFAYPPASPPVTVVQLNAINLALDNSSTAPLSGIVTAGTPAYELFLRKLRGYDSYLRRGTTYRQNFCSQTFPNDYSDVGYINQPGGNAPPPPSGGTAVQNYISTGISWRKQGGVIYVSKSWQLSGPGGWDTYLYTRAAAKTVAPGSTTTKVPGAVKFGPATNV